ncbi:carbamoyl-phosphate synthase [Paenibacillus sp.]|uniref:carboxylate--amine ligase n=1 Tax=Paenibacillus sp. TaxID=58172 RepID=UPI0028126F40|nr:carbamoyl-phosphate synthase [Paenibacillus sp.]
MNHDIPAVVLDLSANGIGIVRALRRKGIRVFAFDTSRNYRTGRTRYATCGLCPHPIFEEEALLRFLLAFGERFPDKAVLYAGADDYVQFMSKYREALAARYLFVLPEAATIDAALDKRLTYQAAVAHGIPSPKTYTVESRGQLQELLPSLQYPCILKPAFSADYRKRMNKKAIVVESAERMEAAYAYYERFGELMIQELVPGEDEHVYELGALFDDDMRLLAVFTGKKLQQYPPAFGSGALAVSVRNEEVIELGLRLLRALSFKGFANVEFKLDPRDRRAKFLEINARTWFWHSLATRCGVDFSYLYYLSVTGQKPEAATTQREGPKWLYPVRYLLAFLERRAEGGANVAEWIRRLRGETEYALFDWSDPLPSLRSFAAHLKSIRLRKK